MSREIVEVSREHAAALAVFFAAIAVDQDTHSKFHPHSFVAEEALKIASSKGRDKYFITLDGGEVVAYGMLRYTEPYPDPTLGIVVKPGHHNQGLGSNLTAHLIDAARKSGAPHITLHVYKQNPAQRLYRRLGFQLEQAERCSEEFRGVLKF